MKIWAYLALAVVVLGFAKWAHGAVYEQGWNAANVANFEVQQEAIAEAVNEARIQWDLSVVAATDNIIIEERIVERVEFVEREVIKIVERVVVPECRDLGPDIQRVFNDAIRAAFGGEGENATDPPVPSG